MPHNDALGGLEERKNWIKNNYAHESSFGFYATRVHHTGLSKWNPRLFFQALFFRFHSVFHDTIGPKYHQWGGSGINKSAQELTRDDRKIVPHPAQPWDQTQGLWLARQDTHYIYRDSHYFSCESINIFKRHIQLRVNVWWINKHINKYTFLCVNV